MSLYCYNVRFVDSRLRFISLRFRYCETFSKRFSYGSQNSYCFEQDSDSQTFPEVEVFIRKYRHVRGNQKSNACSATKIRITSVAILLKSKVKTVFNIGTIVYFEYIVFQWHLNDVSPLSVTESCI